MSYRPPRDPVTGRMVGRPERERFALCCGEPDDAGCIHWTGYLIEGYPGYIYGQFRRDDGTKRPAHRVAVEFATGKPVPRGMHVHHVCGNTRCVNVAHLEVKTPGDHLLDNPKTLQAQNAAKTDCKFGHPFSGDNLYVDRHGKRNCRACGRRKYYEGKARRGVSG